MYIFENSNVSNYLDIKTEDLAVTKLLEKLNINVETSFLYNQNDDYKALVDYISDLYNNKKEISKELIYEINNNLNFKTYLIILIKEKMQNILSNNTTIIFKEIVTIVNLLSFGKKFEIFENYNSYNLENLRALFREFEDNLKEAKQLDEEKFLLIFNQYIALIELLNGLCIINSTDVLRKKTINSLINVISETINTLKFNIKLDDLQIDSLNNIQGKMLFYYSHIPYINEANKDSQYLIDEFKFIFEKLCDGYNLSKNTRLSSEAKQKDYYKTFLNSSSTLLSALFYKLENTYQKEDYTDISKYRNIIELYELEINHIKNEKFETIDDFKNALLVNYLYIYNESSNDNFLLIIEDFIKNPVLNSLNMNMIHSIILFTKEIEEETLLKILKNLISTEKYKNDYHEFYKLNICDLIINKFINNKNKAIDEKIVDDLVDYIETNKIASHLMSIYSKLYLSLSLYYSYYENYEEIEKSKFYYYNYLIINGKELLDNEYSNFNKNILYNHGKKLISDLDLENVMVSDQKCIKIGTNLLQKFSEQQEINLKYTINQKLSNIITEIFTNESLNNELLDKKIESFISRDIFHGLTFSSVQGLCEKECSLIDLGYEKIEIPLIDEYKLKMAYSIVYKDIFENIFEKNKDYIKQNLINLIVSYKKSIPIYNDPITTLYNFEKLKTELLQKEDEDELIFLRVYIEDLEKLNKKYGYLKTNILFKEYVLKINNIVDSFRLNGPEIGLFIDKNHNYEEIIKKIKSIEVTYKEDQIKLNLVFAISWGNKNNLIEKSSYAMSLAQNSKNKYYEFK